MAITLRVVLVENLRRLTDRIEQSRAERQEADLLADSLLGAGGQCAIPPAMALRRFEKTALARAFVVQLVQLLRDVAELAALLHAFSVSRDDVQYQGGESVRRFTRRHPG